MGGGHTRPEGAEVSPAQSSFLFSASLVHLCSLPMTVNYLYICLQSSLLMGQRRAGLAQLLDTKQASTLLSGALPSGLALEGLPAPPRGLDLIHVTGLTQKSKVALNTCSPSQL